MKRQKCLRFRKRKSPIKKESPVEKPKVVVKPKPVKKFNAAQAAATKGYKPNDVFVAKKMFGMKR